MRKGMLSGLWSLKWVLLCLLLTGCPKSDPPPLPPSPEITVTGQVMLGPVVGGHSLKLAIYDTDMKVLDEPKIGLDGSYGFTLKDYEGAVIAQVTSTKPQQECSVGDYIDEATAKPKCLGNNSILSSTVLKLDNTSSDNQAKLHTTSVTTIAALNAGINIKEDGTIGVNNNLSPEIIDQSNKIIARALGLGDQSVAEYTPKSIITTDQKFQPGDAYSQALAEISGIEAEDKSLNSIVQLISADIGINGKLSPAVQDMMVKGNQKVFKTAKEQGADTTILNQINKRQDTYPDSIAKVDLVNAPEPPVFKNKTKTSNQKPTWEWISGGTGNNRYQYRFGAEDDIQNVRSWTETSSSSFTSKDNLKPGKYILEIQEGHTSEQTVWSPASNSIIEIVENQKGSVAIQGESIQGRKLLAVTTDKDGIQGDVSYQWYRDNKTIKNANYSDYVLTENDVNTAIMVKVSYIDNIDYAERDIQSAPVKIDNTNDQPLITSSAKNEAEEGKKYSYQVKIEDSDKNSTAKYRLIAKPNGMAINKVGLITWIPENKVSDYTANVSVEVDDSSGASNATTQQEFIITVKANDDKPVLNKPDNVVLKEDAARHVIALVAKDIDNEDKAITYDVDSNNSEIAKVTLTANNDLQITPIPNKHGTATITVIAKSNNQTATTAFNLNIENTDDAPTLIAGKSIISGSPKQGGTLTADPTVISDADGIIENSYTFEWNANDELLKGETGHTIALTQDHVGKQISVKVSYRDTYGTDYKKSAKTKAIANKKDNPTLIAGKSIISGSPKQGGTLTADPTVISDADGIIENSYTYEWNADDEPLTGKTGNKIALTQDHVGKQISVKVSYTDSYGGDYKESAKTNAIANKKDNPTLIAGKSIISGSPKKGGTLTADPTVISDADGIIENSYTYEWNADDEPLTGKTGNKIALTQDHVGKKISVKVSYTDSYGKDYIKSEKTLDVVNTNDQPKINSDPKLEAEEDKQYTYQLEVTDADKDSQAKYKLVRQQNASKMKISNEGLITWKPENKDRDYTANVTVEVDDETGTSNATNQQEFTINVKAHDDAPKIETKLDDMEVEENSEVIEIPLYTTDIDNENAAITYQATSSDNDIATVEIKNENTLNIRPVKYQYGEVKIIVTAKSNGKMVEKDFQLIIKNKNDAPNGKVTIKFSNQQHRTFVANVDNISDPDGIKGYSYQWKADNSEIMGALQSEFIPTDDEIGKRISVVVTIEDSLGNKSQFISDKTQSLKVNGIPPTVKDVTETLAQSKDSYSNIKTLLETFNYAKYIKYKSTQTPLTFVITSLPSRGVIINNDGIEITKMENGKYLEVSESFKYKRTMAGKDSFEYKGKRDNILSLKPATVNISYNNKAPHAFDFTISAAVETETRPIPFADKITDDQDLTKGIIITNNPQAGNLYIDGESFDASKLETLIDINSNVTYKSTNTSNSSDSFKYLAIDTDDERSYERKVNIEFKHDNKAPKINKEPTQTNLMIDEAGKQISFKFKITDDSSSFKAYEPLFLSTKGNTSQPLWISINTDKQSDSPVNYTVNATLNDKSYANDSIRVLIPVVDVLGLKSKYAFVINPELSVDTQNKFIQKNNTTWVDVCWQFSEKTANLDSTKITEIKQEIMNTISDSWQKNSALKFDWREDDWDAIQDGKRQLFKWDSPSNCAENYTAEYAQVKVYIKQQEEVDSIQAENRFTINLNVKADGSFEDAYPKHRIIHEFGHALGFPDENKRFDIFTGELSKKSIEPWHSWECVKSMNIQKPRVATGSDLISTTAVREISYKEWQQQPYDSYSIMDECIFDNPSVYKNSASNIQTDMLKINDKKRVQKFYGAPIIETESPHLIKDDQFFTGLFLHGSNYFYYGNGVKSSTDRFINTISLKILFDNGILISALSSDINEDVLFKKTYDGDSPPSFISPFPSLLISCSEEQDDNSNGFRYRHADDCNSPDNLIADNKSVYYFYDNPQNIKFYSCATDPNNSSKTNNCSEINNSWLVSDGVLFAKGIKNNATYLYKNY